MSVPLFARHRVIGIDSNLFIYLFDGSGRRAEASGAVLDAIAAGEAEGVVSTLAVAEVATGPARIGDGAMVERYADELESLENVRLIDFDREVAVESALIRGSTSLSLSDSIHLASARLGGASALLTNDRRIGSIRGLEVAYLDDLVIAEG